MPKKRPLFSWGLLLRLLVTAGGVGYLCFFKDWGTIRDAVHQAALPWLAAAFAAYGLTTLLGIFRWHLLLGACGAPVAFTRTAQLTLIGLFANTFMPGGMGGDLFKAVLVAREAPSVKPTVIMSIVMERVLGFVAMFMVSTTLILGRIGPLTEEPVTRYAVILYFAVFFLTLAVIGLGSIPGIGARLPFWQRLPVREKLAEAGKAYQFFLHHKSCFWGGLLYSVAAHLSLLFSCYAVAMALRLELGFWDLGAVLPLIALVTLAIPSVGGLGVRELAFQHFLTYVSVTKETSIALSLVFFAVTLGWGFSGGLVYLFYRSAHPRAVEPQPDEGDV
ncbi:MAG: lysylphosphatidylglycerol synthase transmembrane domain-containing protein [Candidatus Methylacidiphilales bacterium]|nr:lysylphosphatidylglycerol synthase transmembrane domain-containing protein [Candidatus Methylacidiphilales bacterium]